MNVTSSVRTGTKRISRHFKLGSFLFLTAFLATASHSVLNAQTPWAFFDPLTVEDGLSQDIVTAIAQDKTGFMWFGTEDGLNRYDGVQVRTYRNDPLDLSSLPSNNITALHADRLSRIWVGTGDGLAIYEPCRDAFRRVGGDIGWVTDIAQSGDTLWIACAHMLLEICETDTTVRQVFGFTGETLRAVETDGDSILWIGVGSRFLRADRRTWSINSIRGPFKITSSITRIRKHPDGSIWVGVFDGGVFRYTSKTSKTEVLGDSILGGGMIDRGVTSLAIDSSGIVWVGSWSSVEKIKRGDGCFQRVALTSRNPGRFVGQRVYSLFVDRVGSLWIGTYRGGVNHLNPAHQHFSLLNRGSDPEISALSVISSAQGDIWVGTTDGLESWSPGYRSARCYRRMNAGRRSIPLGEVDALCMRHTGELWLGTESNSIARLNVDPGGVAQSRSALSVPGRNRGGEIRTLYEDRSGTMWVGTASGTDGCGFYSFDDRTKTFRGNPWNPGERESFPGNGVWTFFEDSRGGFWVGGDGKILGLRIMDRKSRTFRPFPTDTSSSENYSTRAIAEDRSGDLWFGTWGGGLNRYSESTGKFTRFTEKHGIPSRFIKAMLLDDTDGIWLATERGIARFDIAAGRAKAYSIADGLPVMFFLSGAGSRGKDGRMYFGGRGGVVTFKPESITANPYPPPVAITSFTVFDHPLFGGCTVPPQPVSLEYDQDYFGIEFVGLDFTAPKRNRYAYMLEGFDEGWIDAGTRRYASYTHLPGGSYVFHVRAANNDGLWNETGASLAITIAPPFWGTWTFRIGFLLTVVVGLTLFLRDRLRTILEVERLRRRIAADLHDDVGTNLSTIVLAAEIAKNHGASSREGLVQMEEIAGTALQTQDLMRDIVWMLNPANDSLESFVARLKDTAARVLLNVPFTFVNTGVDGAQNLDLEFKRNVFLIYKEVLNNIIRHSGATSVSIIFEQTTERLRLTVCDNGRGFDPLAVTGDGNGLANMGHRATLVGGTLTVVSSPGKGATMLLDAKIA